MSVSYLIDPKTVKFDTQISTFNRKQNFLEYQKTKSSIEKVGQQEPILMDNGFCIDGRHRVKACIELGIDVIATDIDSKLPIADKLLLANVDLTSGRDLSMSQLSIQAYRFMKMSGTTKVDTAKQFGINKRSLTYCETILTNNEELMQEMYEKGSVPIGFKEDGRPNYTKSLETLYRYVAALEEKVEDRGTTPKIMIDYESAINTQAGVKLFWELKKQHSADHSLCLILIEFVNYRYTLDEEGK